MPVVIDVRSAVDSRDVVHRAVQALAEGKLVAFPTETVYGLAASALDASAVQKLIDTKGRQAGHALPLAVKSADDALDYVPNMGPLGKRLARRCWPGPVTLVMEDNSPHSLLNQLPAEVKAAVSPLGTVGIRVPAHQLMLDVLRMLVGPLVLSSANRTGQPEAHTAQEVVQSLGDDVALVLDDGRCQFGQPSSVVRVMDDELKILRVGVVSETTIHRLASFIVMLVCTGNTCRSPMAEMLLRKLLADKLGCNIDQLEDHGVIVQSAGIAANPGCSAAPEAIEVLEKRGLDLARHESQPLSDRLVKQADLLLTMTRAHRDVIVQHWPDAADRTFTISPDSLDVADPIGGTLEMYEACAEQIEELLKQRLESWPLVPVKTTKAEKK